MGYNLITKFSTQSVLLIAFILDLFFRKIAGLIIHENQEAELSSIVLTDICKLEKINKNQIVVHAGSGRPMKGHTMLATMQSLGVVASFTRPSVSNYNPYSGSLLKTLKYCPMYP